MESKELTKYERARVLGARALQLAMNAPLLIKMSKEDLEKTNYDVLKIAEYELDSGILPISINKPLPEKREETLEKVHTKTMSDQQKEKLEQEDTEEIGEEGEIMELANPEDEREETEGSGEEE